MVAKRCARRSRRGCHHAKEFLTDQAASVLSGKVHHTPRLASRGRGANGARIDRPWSKTDAVVMSLSCAAYLMCSVVWYSLGYTRLQRWFYLVTLCSVLADGVRLPFAAARVADRIVGSAGLITTCIVNCTSPANTALVLVTTASALWWLRQSRAAAARADDVANGHQWYVFWHAGWHVYGAAALCAMTWYIQVMSASASAAGSDPVTAVHADL